MKFNIIKHFVRTAVCFAFLLGLKLSAQQNSRDYIDLYMINDDAGDLSTWMKTGDDLGETYTSHLSFHNFNWSSKLNFAITAESTLYTGLDQVSKAIRDVNCNERNNFRLSLNNRKENSFFYTLTAGCDYIQSKKPGFGASGQAKLYHEKVINPTFPTKYWIYEFPNKPTRVFPFAEARFGFAHSFVNNSRFLLQLVSDAGLLCSTNINFSELRSINQFSAAWKFGKSKSFSLRYDFEYYFSSNFLFFQNSYLKNLFSIKIYSVEFSSGLTIPIVKNLSNPYLPYNDKEIMFHYNVRVYIGKIKQKSKEKS